MARRGRGRPPHPDVLTPAEWAILDAWRHGMSRAVIAARRGVSVYAVRYHLRNIAGKLGVERSSELRHWPGFPVTSGRRGERNDNVEDSTGAEDWMAFFNDPDGNILAIMAHVSPEADAGATAA